MALDRIASIMRFAALVELGAGILLLVDPALVVTLLLGTPTDTNRAGTGTVVWHRAAHNCATWWPARVSAAVPVQVFYSALMYNTLIALFLVFFSIGRHKGGFLLWPAAALHALIAVLLVTTWQRRAELRNAAQR